MAASVNEAFLARAEAVLLAAGTSAASRVYRGRADAFAPEEVPAVNLRRSDGQYSAHGGGVDHSTFEFEVEHLVRGDDWETSADALHMQTHAALQADAVLRGLAKGLRCIRTQATGDTGDQTLGRITATYQAQALVRVGDLTAQVS